MTIKTATLTPEMAEEVRRIVREAVQQPDVIQALERRFRPLWVPQPTWPGWVETVLRELTEAQKRTEARLGELAEAQKRTEERVEELTEAQKRTEARVGELVEAQKRAEERLTRLEITVQELAEAQKRTEARVEELAEAQKHIEERLTRLEITVQELTEAQKRAEERLTRLEITVQKLTEAQKHIEERLTRLEITVQELAEAQKRTEERLIRLEITVQELAEQMASLAAAHQRLEERVDGMNKRLGRLENLLGVDIEVDAQDIVTYVLEQKGYHLLDTPHPLDLDGEIDLAVPVETPDGDQVWVLLEAKARARFKELRRWAQRLHSEGFVRRLEERGVNRPYLFYLFGLRVYSIVEEEARRLGLGVLGPDGERVEPTPIQ